MWSQEKYLRAFLFAAEAHNTQKYPGTKLPYLVHVSLVAMEVMSAVAAGEECDGDLAVQCSLLHDAIEDADITRSQLEREFGLAVAEAVQGLTKDRSLPPQPSV
jgi:(p)ppGpp synthase/HD superfamily hydrolase